MLFWVILFIKLLEFWGLIAMGYIECINPLGVRFGIEVSFARAFPKLRLDCFCNQVLDLFDGHRPRRLTILKLTILL